MTLRDSYLLWSGVAAIYGQGGNSKGLGWREKRLICFLEKRPARLLQHFYRNGKLYILQNIFYKNLLVDRPAYTLFLCLKVESYNKKSFICFLEKRRARLLQLFYRNEKLYVLLNIFYKNLLDITPAYTCFLYLKVKT